MTILTHSISALIPKLSRVIGLTGGIGSGKSHAASYLKTLGALIVDADKVGHEGKMCSAAALLYLFSLEYGSLQAPHKVSSPACGPFWADNRSFNR